VTRLCGLLESPLISIIFLFSVGDVGISSPQTGMWSWSAVVEAWGLEIPRRAVCFRQMPHVVLCPACFHAPGLVSGLKKNPASQAHFVKSAVVALF